MRAFPSFYHSSNTGENFFSKTRHNQPPLLLSHLESPSGKMEKDRHPEAKQVPSHDPNCRCSSPACEGLSFHAPLESSHPDRPIRLSRGEAGVCPVGREERMMAQPAARKV